MSLFAGEEGAVRHGAGGTGIAAYEEQQRPTVSERKRALPEALMEEVVEPGNLNRAYQRVKANQGVPGVDGMTVEDLGGWLVWNTGRNQWRSCWRTATNRSRCAG